MRMIFNDQDRQNIDSLRCEIEAIDTSNALKRRIAFYNFTIPLITLEEQRTSPLQSTV